MTPEEERDLRVYLAKNKGYIGVPRHMVVSLLEATWDWLMENGWLSEYAALDAKE